MAKFKVGDRVRNTAIHMAAHVGALATVTEKAEFWCDICKATLVDVRWDDGESRNKQSHGGYYPQYFDLVPTSPIRVVTRREIVPGTYGVVQLFDDGSAVIDSNHTANDLRAAAALFDEIADVLDENAKEVG